MILFVYCVNQDIHVLITLNVGQCGLGPQIFPMFIFEYVYIVWDDHTLPKYTLFNMKFVRFINFSFKNKMYNIPYFFSQTHSLKKYGI